MNSPNEARFETHIEKALNSCNYTSYIYTEYNKEYCLLPEVFVNFIKNTQLETYKKLQKQFLADTNTKLYKTFTNQVAKRGIIDVLRKGIQTSGCSFNLVYFKPKSGLNPEHLANYKKNEFSVVRQVHYSIRNENSIDLVLFLNGIPIVTIEVKNQLTGQNIVNAEKQYKQDRKPEGEPLLQFKRCLVHFCVDNDRVSMTTRLSGTKTRFLPYNKGITNPSVEGDYKSEYLWNDIFLPDTLLEIIENFVLVAIDKKKVWNKKQRRVVEEKSDVLIFPRYHQLNVIRKIKAALKTEGVGNNYLVQHTTGSGKSFSIGWLAHTLTSLFQNKESKNRMFDTILVVTDRKVLDKQLQNTLKQLEQTEGVVNPVDLNSQQLKEYLEAGKDIIITTIQKFPVISDAISRLKSKTFAVIIDEVHSSQSGETAKHLKKSISPDLVLDDEGGIDYEEMIRRDIESRGKQDHISFFGFTGTPKNKTLRLFGRQNSDGNWAAFDNYTMQQSIAEGFTLDVLANYTTYKRYFKVKQTKDTSDELPKSDVMRQLVDFVDSHDEVLRQKVGIILDHFVGSSSKEINGTARAMVVVRSRKHCVLFQQQMVKQMKERGLSYSCLVAFSSTIKVNGADYTETGLNKDNGMEGNSIPDSFKDPRFRILIVSSKFQTGFDEPLVQSMYVDKKLGGAQCVQTLSRLNRTTKAKTQTFVLDFANDGEDIVAAFQPFFTSTVMEGDVDPDQLYNLQYDIEQYGLFTSNDVEAFCAEFYKPTDTDEALQPIISKVVDAWGELETEERKSEFKADIQSFLRLYSYISQIMSFTEINWEKLYVFLRYVNKKLPKGKGEPPIRITDAIDLDSLRIQYNSKTNLSLVEEEGVVMPISGAGGGFGQEEELDLLSEIIAMINDRFGIDLTDDDRIDLERVQKRMQDNNELRLVVTGDNSEADKKDFAKKIAKGEFSEFYGDRLEFYKKVMDEKVFPMLFDGIYNKLQRHIRETG